MGILKAVPRHLNFKLLVSDEYMVRPENVYPQYFNTLNQKTVINKLCALENAEDGLIFSSGMAAISTVMFSILKSGNHIV